MKIKAANGFARILKTEGIPWVSCYPTNHVNNALGEEGVPILMMGEERFAVAVADGFSRVTSGRSGPEPDDVKTAVRTLLGAKDPLLYVGEGVLYADATSELLKFAELAQVPVLTTLKGKSAFPENHPLSVGCRGSLAEHFLRKADVLFSIGSSLFPNRFSHAVPDADKKTIIQCTVDTLDINRSYETRHAVIGDAKLTLEALIAEVSARGARQRPELIEEIKGAKAAFLEKFRPLMDST